MKIFKSFLLFGMFALSVVLIMISCKKDDKEDLIGNWVELADFIGDARNEAVAFAIGETGYVGTGYNGDERITEFAAYDANANNWHFIANPPAEFVARTGAAAFAANGKGYVGSGRDDKKELSDFWVYDPATNLWDSIADMPGARYGAIAFSINGIGYVGTGYNAGSLLDFYSYDPATDVWTAIANYPSKVSEAVAFVIDQKAYVCTGEKNGSPIDDFFSFDPSTGSWTALRKISNDTDNSFDDDYAIVRKKAIAFTIGGKGYVTTGENNTIQSDVWEYDPATDLWLERTSFEATGRTSSVAFTTESGRGFVVGGASGSTYFDDLYEFHPTEIFNDND